MSGAAPRDNNYKPVLMGVSSVDGVTPVPLRVNPVTKRVIAEMAGGTAGDVVGPSGAVDGNFAEFDGASGKKIKDSGKNPASFATAAQGSKADSAVQPADLSSYVPTSIAYNFFGTGIKSGLAISINTDPTKIDISAGKWNKVDNSNPDAPILTPIIFPGVTGVVLTHIASADATYLAVDSSNNVIQQTTPFTPTQRRGYAICGAAIHSNRTTVNVVNNLPDVILDGICQYNDLLDGLKNFNIEGNIFSANGANLSINKSAGYIFKRGSNFANDPLNPHKLLLAALTAPSNIRYRLQNGTEYSDTNVIDPGYYDVSGTRTAVTSGNFTIQRITIFKSNLVRIQYGQAQYATKALAIQGIQTEPFVTEANIADNGLLRCLLVVRSNATNLSNTNQAVFIEADRFGSVQGSGSGSATTTLQQSYDNSVQPQITTDATLGAIQIKRGSAADTDKIFEGLNGSGTSIFSIFGNGHIDMSHSLNEIQGADIASAATTDIGAATGNLVKVTGVTTITGLGTVQAGTERTVIFTGALILTHNATSLILPTGANITTAANDRAIFRSLGSGNWICISYQRADGTALAAASGGYEFERVFLNSPTITGLDSQDIARANVTLSQLWVDTQQLPIAQQSLTTTGTTDFPIGNIAANTKIAEVFTASSSFSALTLAIRVKKVGTPTDNLSVNIYATSSNLPTGSSVATATYALAGAAATTSYIDYAWEVPTYALTSSTVYSIVIERSGAVDASNYWVVEGIATGGATGAQMALYGGSSWSANGTNMLRFAINGADVIDTRKRSDETAQANTDSIWTNYFCPAITALASAKMKSYTTGFTGTISANDRVQFFVRKSAYVPSLASSLTWK